MRKVSAIPQPSPKLPPSRRPLGDVLSLEEAEFNMDEAKGYSAASTTSMAEVHRIQEIADALEDLALIADGIDEASEVEIRLIETAGDMAVAGLDVPPEQIVPSMEAYRGRKIATEGMAQTAKTLWASIQKFLVKIWGYIKAFFESIGNSIPTLRKRLRDMEQRAHLLSNTTPAVYTHFAYNTGVKALSIKGKPVENFAQLEQGVLTELETAQAVFVEYPKSIEAIMKVIELTMNHDSNDLTGAMSQMREGLMRHIPWHPPGAKPLNKTRKPGSLVVDGAELFGNAYLSSEMPVIQAGGSDLVALNALRSYQVVLDAEEREEHALTAKQMHEFSIPKKAELLKMCQQLELLLDAVEENTSTGHLKKLESFKDLMETWSVEAEKKQEEKAAKDPEQQEEDIHAFPFYRMLVNYNVCYAHWIQSPAVSMTNHVFTTVKAVMILLDRSIKSHTAGMETVK